MREINCPYCDAPIALGLWQSVPNHIGRPDVKCSRCQKESFFPFIVKLVSYLLGAVALIFALGLYTKSFSLESYPGLAFGWTFAGLAYTLTSAAICYRSSVLVKNFWSISNT